MFRIFDEIGNQMLLTADEEELLSNAVERLNYERSKEPDKYHIENMTDCEVVESIINDAIQEDHERHLLDEKTFYNRDEIREEFFTGNFFVREVED